MKKELIVLVAPPGAGKSTLAKSLEATHLRISQDAAGKEGHMRYFLQGLADGQSMVIDRMNFNKEQRKRYLEPAKKNGYTTKIIVLHENKETCMTRMLAREGHETIKDEENAKAALHTFFRFYERPQEGEADEIEFVYPNNYKPQTIICDLDGTLCDTTHRQHFVQRENGKKDWRGFFAGMDKDPVNEWCRQLLYSFHNRGYNIVYCSGRGEEYKDKTITWLKENFLYDLCGDIFYETHDIFGNKKYKNHKLFMREEKDSRVDWQIKENILDFEILSRYTPLFAIDDRTQVVQMYRRRGIVVLQCSDGNF